MAADDADSGDMVKVASFFTPTEAYVLKSALAAADVDSMVADANLGQAHPWMTNAMGGIRVLVPASQVQEARRVMESLDAGDYAIEGDDEAVAVAPLRLLERPVYSPDAAAFWSFLLTPVFGATLHLLNARSVGDAQLVRVACGWLVTLVLGTALSLYAALGYGMGASLGPRASFIACIFTLLWYFTGGMRQSRFLLANYGPKYARRNLFKPALAVALAMLAAGWLAGEFT